MAIKIDKSDFDRKSTEFLRKMKLAKRKAVRDVAEEILRLSTFEVPHDKGLLQNSGHYVMEAEAAVVGYNKVYAARLHEHPEYRFQKGRKGKYLEDPIKRNLAVFRSYMAEVIRGNL